MSTNEETPSSVAFEVDIKENPDAPVPKHILERFTEEKEISGEDINAKLTAAEERKKQLDAEKAQKAASEVAHAKKVAEEQRRLSDAKNSESLAKLQEKLSQAETRRQDKLHKNQGDDNKQNTPSD
ncbi:13432_t:CDS:1 [Cetraspora pellucida]|uniref:13432_t:CDS:1 n=1 Tax=Cetraspora pellucida TaxID=1433469 RepID=A0ACA9MC42_9GLOM|nr:13432_t:CDS:1 [Cetraspora pellucida]